MFPANLTAVLREEGRSVSSGRGARALRRTLVVAQVAFTFVLLVGAGLLLASFRRVLQVDPGFRAERVLTASVIAAPLPLRNAATQRRGSPTEALRQIRALPGVVVAPAPPTPSRWRLQHDNVILAEGYQMKPGESVIAPSQVDVTPGYFEATRSAFARAASSTDSTWRKRSRSSSSTRRWRGGSGRTGPDRAAPLPPHDINDLLSGREDGVPRPWWA